MTTMYKSVFDQVMPVVLMHIFLSHHLEQHIAFMSVCLLEWHLRVYRDLQVYLYPIVQWLSVERTTSGQLIT